VIFSALKLLLPAIIPSWNFFDVIVPSPRIQIALLQSKKQTKPEWAEFRPRPRSLSVKQLFVHLFWNAQWNESLFLVSCAERLIDYPTQHSEEEIFTRIINDTVLKKHKPQYEYIKFRLVFVRREGEALIEEVRYQSKARQIENDR